MSGWRTGMPVGVSGLQITLAAGNGRVYISCHGGTLNDTRNCVVFVSMQTIPSQLATVFRQAIAQAFDGLEADPLIGLSQNAQFGDYQSNCAMGLAKLVAAKTGEKTNPQAIARGIVARLQLAEMATTDIAGPGFINIRLNPVWLAKQVSEIASDNRLGVGKSQTPIRVVIDYSSPNVAKQMHVGHLRPTNIGDAISRIVEFQGHTVIRQNHLGDWGTQFGMLLRYLEGVEGQADAQVADLEGFYRAAKKRFDEDTQFADEARDWVVKLQAGDAHALELWTRIMDQSRSHFEALYKRMGILLTRSDERGESFYNPLLGDVVKELKDKGIAEVSEGATVVWVKGFETPLIIQKTGGGFGYGTTDLAALRFRVRELNAGRVIVVTDARQVQHFRMFLDAAKRAGWLQGVEFDHIMFGMILGEDGTPLKTRSGETVKLVDVLDEGVAKALEMVRKKLADRGEQMSEDEQKSIAAAVGIGAIKYFDLNRDPIGNYVFDWSKMLSLEGNTAPYLQYAYARVRSIFRKAGHEVPAGAKLQLEHPAEVALAKHILRLGEVTSVIARELKPHHLCSYLYELSTKFSGFYENCPVLQSDEPLRSSRMVLCDMTARTLALGLDLLGIEHPERM